MGESGVRAKRMKTAIGEYVPLPPIKKLRKRCGVKEADVIRVAVCLVVSPTRTAHFGESYGDTSCGVNATSDGWWWSL